MQRSPQPDSEDGDGPGPDGRPEGRRVPAHDDVRGSGRGSADDAASQRRELIRWAGLSTEVVASVGLSVFLGVKADKWLKVSFPIFSWALPLLVIVALLINLIKAGTNKKNGK